MLTIDNLITAAQLDKQLIQPAIIRRATSNRTQLLNPPPHAPPCAALRRPEAASTPPPAVPAPRYRPGLAKAHCPSHHKNNNDNKKAALTTLCAAVQIRQQMSAMGSPAPAPAPPPAAPAAALAAEPCPAAMAKKNQGNVFYKGGQIPEAIEAYTAAIKALPRDDHPEASKIYGNRAACYKNLYDYTNVIADCSSALKVSRRRDCHFDDTPCLFLLKHLIKVEGGVQQNDSLADGY